MSVASANMEIAGSTLTREPSPRDARFPTWSGPFRDNDRRLVIMALGDDIWWARLYEPGYEVRGRLWPRAQGFHDTPEAAVERMLADLATAAAE